MRETADPLPANALRIVADANGTRGFSDGTVAASCKRYLQSPNYRGGVGDGVYRIQTAAGVVPVFCDMNTNGGGWTMVGYYRHPSTENGPADLDNRDYSYFMRARTDAAYGRPSYYANPNSDGMWTDWRPLSSVHFPLEFAVLIDQGGKSFSTSWEGYQPKVIYRVRSRDVMPNYGTNQDLTTGDNLQYRVAFNNGWTDVGGNSASGIYYWYPYDSANNYLTLFHVSNYFYIDGRAPTNYHYAQYAGSGIPGGNNDWHHESRLLVRELD
jgi:hypothetical protein